MYFQQKTTNEYVYVIKSLFDVAIFALKRLLTIQQFKVGTLQAKRSNFLFEASNKSCTSTQELLCKFIIQIRAEKAELNSSKNTLVCKRIKG